MGSLLWFKRDLRVTDNAALAAAAEAGPVVALYVVEPAYWALPDTSARQWEFTRECVESLREALPVPLLVRVGQAVEVFEDLRASFAFDAVYSHEETGNGWTYQRDLAVRDWCAARGLRGTSLLNRALCVACRTAMDGPRGGSGICGSR